ncbi:general stress protein [Oceanobacillus arenosus]|uniref:General stress protein n=1 Tax=Oceanobacillus arenosus TaxID=1229153 RepID=A0A3D8PZC9_9BACI|nr:general stress protein [Oceanobacillus arenosus]RDW21333.1 general stress protein [Oceanobacillus arenosus]
MENVYVVENGVQAKAKIEQLAALGYTKDDIYLIAHDKKRMDDLSDELHVNEVGIEEEGLFDKIANVFRKRGDELRSQFENLGLTQAEAEKYEEELDNGRVVVIGKK